MLQVSFSACNAIQLHIQLSAVGAAPAFKFNNHYSIGLQADEKKKGRP
jgi:hypothetical protein